MLVQDPGQCRGRPVAHPGLCHQVLALLRAGRPLQEAAADHPGLPALRRGLAVEEGNSLLHLVKF